MSVLASIRSQLVPVHREGFPFIGGLLSYLGFCSLDEQSRQHLMTFLPPFTKTA